MKNDLGMFSWTIQQERNFRTFDWMEHSIQSLIDVSMCCLFL